MAKSRKRRGSYEADAYKRRPPNRSKTKPQPVPVTAAGRRRILVASKVVSYIEAELLKGSSVHIPCGKILAPGQDGPETPVAMAEIGVFLDSLVRSGKVTALSRAADGFTFSVIRSRPTAPKSRSGSRQSGPTPWGPAIGDVMREVLAAVDQGARRHSAVRGAAAKALGFPQAATTRWHAGDSFDRRVSASLSALRDLGCIRHERADISILPAGRSRLASDTPFTGSELPVKYRGQSANRRLALHEQAGKVAASIPDMEPDQLIRLWRNANRILSDATRFAEHRIASVVVEAVESAWDALELAEEQLFAWPSTEVGFRSGASQVSGFRSEGMLSYLEYRVGKEAGLPAAVRQSILARVFEGKLPRVFEPTYMNEWGIPSSATRLRKMAESLAAFARNFKRQDEDRYDEAIRQWEQDLEFLHDRYYVGKFGFGWPSTSVSGSEALPRKGF